MKTNAFNKSLLFLRKLFSRSINIFFWATIIYSAYIKVRLKKCGKGTRFRLSTFVIGHNNIIVGDNFLTMGFLYLYANDGGYLEIGNGCSCSSNVYLGAAHGKIIIGDCVMIGQNVVIRSCFMIWLGVQFEP